MSKKYSGVILGVTTIVVMIALIPFVRDDIALAGIYTLLVVFSFLINYQHGDIFIFVACAVLLFISEYFFISTGVETFVRRSLLGVMPLWLPILWGYAFVAIRRFIVALEGVI